MPACPSQRAMRQKPDIRRRAAAAGIMTEWVDFSGKQHAVSDDSLLALLTALGIEAEPGPAPSTLPPLITARAGERFAMPLRSSTADMRWIAGRPETPERLECKRMRDGLTAIAPDVP